MAGADDGSGGGGGDGRRTSGRARKPSLRVKDMEGVDFDEAIREATRKKKKTKKDKDEDDEDEDERSGDSGSESSGSSSSSSSSESEEEEEYNSEVEEYIKKAAKRKRERESKPKTRYRYVRGEDGQWGYEQATVTPGKTKRFDMSNFTASPPAPQFFEMMTDPQHLRDFFLGPKLLSAVKDLPNLGATCKGLSPILTICAESYTPAQRPPWWARNKEKKKQQESGRLTVDFTLTKLAYPARFVASLGLPRSHHITSLSIKNMGTSELAYELAAVFESGMPSLVSLNLDGGRYGSRRALGKGYVAVFIALTKARDHLPNLRTLSLAKMKVTAKGWQALRTSLRVPLAFRKAVLPPSDTSASSPSKSGGGGVTTTAKPKPKPGSGNSASTSGAGSAAKKKVRPSAATTAKKGRATTAASAKGEKAAVTIKKKKTGLKIAAPATTAKASVFARLECLTLKDVGHMPEDIMSTLTLAWRYHKTPLKRLSLDNDEVPNRWVKELAQFIESKRLPHLTSVSISSNVLNDPTAASLISALGKGKANVTELALSRERRYTPMGVEITGRALVDSLVQAARAPNSKLNGGLRKLTLKWTSMAAEPRHDLAAFLLGLQIDDDGALIPEADDDGDQEERAERGSPLPFPKLEALTLRDCGYSGASLKHMLKAALETRRITQLDLSFNKGDKKCVKALVKQAVKILPKLRLPEDQCIKLRLLQFGPQYRYGWGYGYLDASRRFSHSEIRELEVLMKKQWRIKFHTDLSQRDRRRGYREDDDDSDDEA